MDRYTAEEQKANRAKWVEALRSGRYEQTRAALREHEGYCCLGVACEISGLGKWVRHHPTSGPFYFKTEYDYEDSGTLPNMVREWLGLRHEDGSFESDGENCALTLLNDERDYDFHDIAQVIEEEPFGLIIS